MGVMSAASAAAQYQGQKENADAQAGYENQMYSATAKNATANYLNQVSQTQLGLDQARMSATESGLQNQVAGMSGKATAATMMGEHGVTGNSVKELLSNFDRIQQGNNTTLATNLRWQQLQGQQQMLGYQAQAQGRIAAATPAPVVQPSAAALGIGLAGAGLQAYDGYQRYTMSGPYSPNGIGGGYTPLAPLPGALSGGSFGNSGLA